MTNEVSKTPVDAVLAGTAKLEELAASELGEFADRLPEAFRQPEPELIAAYKTLSPALSRTPPRRSARLRTQS